MALCCVFLAYRARNHSELVETSVHAKECFDANVEGSQREKSLSMRPIVQIVHRRFGELRFE